MKGLLDNIRAFRHHSIFVRLMALLNAVILVSLIGLGAVVYNSSRKNIIDVVIESNQLITTQMRTKIENEIEVLDRLTMQLALEANVKSAVSSSRDTASYRYVNSHAIKNINSVTEGNEQILDIWVQLGKTNAVLTDSARYDEEFFFGDVLEYLEEPDFNEPYHVFPNLVFLGEQKVQKGYSKDSVLTFARAIPLDTLQPSGLIGANLDPSRFQGLLDALNQGSHSFFYILSAQGDSIVQDSLRHETRPQDSVVHSIWKDIQQSDEAETYRIDKIDGQKFLITHCSSAYNGWSYIAITPVETINQSVAEVKLATVVAIAIAFGISLPISYLLARRLYEPVSHVVTMTRSLYAEMDSLSARDEMSFIGTIIDNSYQQNDYLQALYLSKLPTLQDELLNGIISGKVEKETIEERCREVELYFPFQEYIVVSLEIAELGEYPLFKRKERGVEEILENYAEANYQEIFQLRVLYKGKRMFACLINMESNDVSLSSIRQYLHEVNELIYQEHGMVFSAGIGSVVQALSKTQFSFIDSVAALKYSEIRGQGSLIHIDEINTLPKRQLTYSIKTEMQLMNYIKTGELDKQKKIVEEILPDSESLTTETVQNSCYALIGTAIRTIYEIESSVQEIFDGQTDLYALVMDTSGIEQRRQEILSLFKHISDFIGKSQQTQNQYLKEQIDFLIQENNGNITLAEIAKSVDLSYNYLSSIFKEVTGEGFVDYVNQYRINLAKTLLLTTEEAMAEIAKQVGFLSANTFIKVFKRYTGITPGQYRETGQ